MRIQQLSTTSRKWYEVASLDERNGVFAFDANKTKDLGAQMKIIPWHQQFEWMKPEESAGFALCRYWIHETPCGDRIGSQRAGELVDEARLG